MLWSRTPTECALSYRVKNLVLLVALASAVSVAHGTTITVDLGRPSRVTGEKTVSVDGLNTLVLAEQTLSLDYVFTEGTFIRLPVVKKTGVTGTGFSFQPTLTLFGSGAVKGAIGTGYVFDGAHNRIGEVQSFNGASVVTNPGGESIQFSVGNVSPLLNRPGMTSPIDIHGAHFELMLPNAPGFRVTGAQLNLSANGFKPWNNQFEIRNSLSGSGGGFKRQAKPWRRGARGWTPKPAPAGSATPP